jgi:hypothetical protein
VEEVKRIRDAIQKGDSILTDQEVRQITQQATLLGEDGDAMIREILNQVKEVINQPADVLRVVEDYLRKLGRRAALQELSLELEKKMAPERTVQLKAVEAKAEKLQAASSKGNMAGIARGHGALRDQLNTYFKALKADEEREMVSSYSTGTWYRAIIALTKEIMDKVGPYVRTVADEKEGALGPLRSIMETVADLNEATTRAEDEPEEVGLRVLGRKLSKVKGDLLSLGQALMLIQDPSLAAGAHKLVGEAEEAIRAGQQKVRAALRGIGAASDVSETGSADLSGQCDIPAVGRAPVGKNTQPVAALADRRPLIVIEPGNEVADLIWCLSGVQTNDSRWPVFTGKYVEYPQFR